MAWNVKAGPSTSERTKLCKDEQSELVLGLISPNWNPSSRELVGSTSGRGTVNRQHQYMAIGPFEADDDDLVEDHSHPAPKKRRLTVEQVKFLEMSFETENKLDPERKALIAKRLGLLPRQVAIWFQNRRARWKNKRLEQEYATLKAKHETVVKEKENLVQEGEALIEENKRLQVEVARLMELLERPGGEYSTEGGEGDSCGAAGGAEATRMMMDTCEAAMGKRRKRSSEGRQEGEEGIGWMSSSPTKSDEKSEVEDSGGSYRKVRGSCCSIDTNGQLEDDAMKLKQTEELTEEVVATVAATANMKGDVIDEDDDCNNNIIVNNSNNIIVNNSNNSNNIIVNNCNSNVATFIWPLKLDDQLEQDQSPLPLFSSDDHHLVGNLLHHPWLFQQLAAVSAASCFEDACTLLLGWPPADQHDDHSPSWLTD